MESQEALYNPHPRVVVLYSADWCPECDRVRSLLVENSIKFIEVNTVTDPQAGEFLERTSRRVRLPTVFFPDGTMSVEPSNDEIIRHLPR